MIKVILRSKIETFYDQANETQLQTAISSYSMFEIFIMYTMNVYTQVYVHKYFVRNLC